MMGSEHSDFPKDLLSPLGNSGFPFQTAIAATIGSLGPYVVEEEVAWQDGDGSHKFLDIVASSSRVRLCIECKAMRNDKLVFLLPQKANQARTADIHGVILDRMQDSTRRPVVRYGTCQAPALMPESTYCVVLGKTSGDGRLIEREAQPLVRGTEEYARDRYRQFNPEDQQPQSVMCIPVLFTTAKLFVAEYDPLRISLTDGIYQAREEHLQPIQFVRFAKEFTSFGPERTRLRTAIIAQATNVAGLVSDLDAMQVPTRSGTAVPIWDSAAGEARRQR